MNIFLVKRKQGYEKVQTLLITSQDLHIECNPELWNDFSTRFVIWGSLRSVFITTLC